MREFAESYVAIRERMGLPLVNADDVMWARAVDVVLDGSRRVDLLTSRDVAAAVRSAKATVWRAEQKRQYEQLVKAVVVHVRRNRVRLAADADLENRARSQCGKRPIERNELVIELAMEEMAESGSHTHRVADERTTHAVVASVRQLLQGDDSPSPRPKHRLSIGL